MSEDHRPRDLRGGHLNAYCSRRRYFSFTSFYAAIWALDTPSARCRRDKEAPAGCAGQRRGAARTEADGQVRTRPEPRGACTCTWAALPSWPCPAGGPDPTWGVGGSGLSLPATSGAQGRLGAESGGRGQPHTRADASAPWERLLTSGTPCRCSDCVSLRGD